MSESYLELVLPDVAGTEAVGDALATAYVAMGHGDRTRGAVVYLEGDLGAGKTTCVRSLLRALGVVGLVRSPTFTLLETYDLPSMTCVHVDLYRLQGTVEVDELGLRDYLNGDCLVLVEWPEKGRGVLPPADLYIGLSYLTSGRRCRLDARSAPGQEWLASFARDNRLASYVSI